MSGHLASFGSVPMTEALPGQIEDLPQTDIHPAGLWSLSRRFWACLSLGFLFVLFDAFETIGFLRHKWLPVSGRPDLVRFVGEANPITRALAAMSPNYVIVQHLALIAFVVLMCWVLTRARTVRRLTRRTPSPWLIRLRAPTGAAMIRMLSWAAPVILLLFYVPVAI
jgi:hypothetical protein